MPNQQDPHKPFSLPPRTTKSNRVTVSNEGAHPIEIDKLARAVILLARAKLEAESPKKPRP